MLMTFCVVFSVSSLFTSKLWTASTTGRGNDVVQFLSRTFYYTEKDWTAAGMFVSLGIQSGVEPGLLHWCHALEVYNASNNLDG